MVFLFFFKLNDFSKILLRVPLYEMELTNDDYSKRDESSSLPMATTKKDMSRILLANLGACNQATTSTAHVAALS